MGGIRMKKNKRILAAIMAAIMCISAASCGKSGGGSSSGTASKDAGSLNPYKEEITIRILENDTAKAKGYLDELLKAFNEAYGDQGVVAVDANMDEYSDLAENGPYGYGPDVIYQANDKLMTYASDKHLLAINKDDYECSFVTPDAAWDAFAINVDGNTYTCGVPVNVQEPMLFYRADKMPENWETEWDDDKNGVADFFENWNDLYALSVKIRESGDGKFGYMSSLNNLYLNANFLFSYGAYVFGENEDGTLDSTDIGFAKGNAANGMMSMMQFAAVMNEGCIDDTITTNRYEKVANGDYFCAVSTPDTYTVFVEKLALQYESEGLSEEEALKKAQENLKMIEMPAKAPADGDLSKDSSTMTDDDWVDTVVMGGVNGYGISAYTKYKEACIAFVNFATSYDMIRTRMDLLGIAPTRSDAAEGSGDISSMIFDSLKAGRISLMPSIKAVDQIWTPMHTLMGDIAKDPYRPDEEKKYAAKADIQAALEQASKNIYDAIYTLAE